MNSRTSMMALLAALLAGGAGCGRDGREELRYPQDRAYESWVGQEISLKFTALDGREIDLQKLRGKVVLLDFWATWCGPCMEQLPELKEVHRRFQGQGLEIIGISSDFERTALEGVVKREQLGWPQYFDGAGRDNAIVKQFGIRHYPSMWLVDRQGRVRHISAGASLANKVARLLREPVPAAVAVSPATNSLETRIPWKDRLLAPFSKGGGQVDPVAAAAEISANPRNYLTLKNITLTATCQTAILKTETAMLHVVPGFEFEVRSSSGPVRLVCQRITRDAVVLQVPGQVREIVVKFE